MKLSNLLSNLLFYFITFCRRPPMRLKMGDTLLEYSDSMKYLGCYFDRALTWQMHVQQKIMKAKRLIMKVRDAIGSIWGPTPKALKWFYNGVVLSGFSYGAVIWARAVQMKATKEKLKKLNRIMATTMVQDKVDGNEAESQINNN